jgi:hypothetical protein
MRNIKEQSLIDEFISIHELRKRNKLKSNFFKDQSLNEQFSYQPQKSFDINSRWEKLKSYLLDVTDFVLYESSEDFEDLPSSGTENRNLMLALDTGNEIQYQPINLGRVQANISLSFIINSALSKLEQILKKIQIGLVLDAETLEFNQDCCDCHTSKYLSQKKEIRLVEVFDDGMLKLKKKKLLETVANIFQQIKLIFPSNDLANNLEEPNHSFDDRSEIDEFGNDP